MVNVLGVIQARMGSRRLPGKMMMRIAGQPMLKLIIDRLKRAEEINKLVLATSVSKENDVLERLASSEEIECYRGSEEDVLDRFYQIYERYHPKYIVRICADNPLIDPVEVDKLIVFHSTGGYDYCFNHIPYNDNGYPDGVGAEIVTGEVFERIWEEAKESRQREHCFDYIWDNWEYFKIGVLKADKEIMAPEVKLDVDTRDDLDNMRNLVEHYTYNEIVELDTSRILQIRGKRWP